MRCLRTAPTVTAPIPRRTFQSFGALRNLPCATGRSVRSIFGCGIDLRVSNKVGARASGPHLALLLDTLGKMRAGGPRSNLRRSACMRRIDSLFVIPDALARSGMTSASEWRRALACGRASMAAASISYRAFRIQRDVIVSSRQSVRRPCDPMSIETS